MKNKAKHTPGPWVEDMCGEIWGPSGEYIVNAFLYIRGQNIKIEIQEGNARLARLIAAAPDLLAALENILQEFVHVPGDIVGNKARTVAAGIIGRPNAALARACEAIDKANGW